MPLHIVLDRPHSFAGRRLRHRVVALVGALLFLVGLAASVVAVPATVLTVAWFLGENVGVEAVTGRPLTPGEILTTCVASIFLSVFASRKGLALVRGRRSLVLFLRRFGYDDAAKAVTYAVTRTIGGSWRVVTLDDAEVAPLGVNRGVSAFFGLLRGTVTTARAVIEPLARTLPVALIGFWVIVGLDLARARIWEHAGSARAWEAVLNPYLRIVSATFNGHLPLGAVGLSFPGAFALLAVVFGGIVLALGMALTAAPLAWAVSAVSLLVLSIVLSFPAGAVRDAELTKTREIRTGGEIASVADAVAEESRKVFGPRLVVLRVASIVWRQAVSRLAQDAAVCLIDVSEPSGNLLWEIEELTTTFRTKCVFICRRDRAEAIVATHGAEAPGFDDEMARLLELEEVLVYSSDPEGSRRFARALRSTLLARFD